MTVDELGSILREAREAKGLTLSEAQDATRISLKYLEALENAQYDALPTRVHVRGYLRNYARYLGLDPDPLLERYEVGKDQRPPQPISQKPDSALPDTILPPQEDQVFFDPVNVELAGDSRREGGSAVRWFIIIALLISLALVANRFIPMLRGDGDGTASLTAGIQEAVDNITNNDEAPEATTSPDATIIPGAGQPITSTSRNVIVDLPTPTATRPSLPATLEAIRLRLDITERTWMRVTIDDEVVFEGLARKGDGPYQWEAEQQAQLLTGNAIGIVVTINDVELGRLGGRGEVVDETWTTTGNG